VNGTRAGTGVYKNYNVFVNDIPLPNVTDPTFPPGTQFKTTIYTVENTGDIVDTFMWDPTSGINPVLGAPANFATASAPAMLLLIAIVAFLLSF